MFSRGPALSQRSLVALIFITTVAPLLILLWLGWRLLEQDRILERQQAQERVERAADLAVASLQQSISASEQQLAAGSGEWPEGAVSLVFRPTASEGAPRNRIAYLPEIAPLPEAPPDAFTEAETLEFQKTDRAAAIRAYRELATSPNPSIRATALLRAARNLAATGQTAEALAAYAQLTDAHNVAVGGVPIALSARYARCKLFEQQQRLPELRKEAQTLTRALHAGTWALTAPVYWLYVRDAARWQGSETTSATPGEHFAAAAAQLWERRAALASSGRELLQTDGSILAVLWRKEGDTLRALLAGPEFIEAHWLPGVHPALREQRAQFALSDSTGTPLFGAANREGMPAATRTAQAAGLPWNLVAYSLDPPGGDAAFTLRRRLLIAGFVLLVSMAMLASYLIYRAVHRELAVARLQSDFVAAVSHEFRTPLTALRQFTDMLREKDTLSNERRRLAYDAQSRATERLERLVESLLDFRRMEAGEYPYRFEPRDCAELVRGVVEDFLPEARAAGFAVEFSGSVSALVETDAESLSRAIRNLLDNAVKYSTGRDKVEVDLSCRERDVAIAVHDHGMGIPARERSRIFRKFQRGEQARSSGIKGTGLGLAMVDEIVRAHHGRVEVESEPGKGSTFTIVLPLRRETANGHHEPTVIRDKRLSGGKEA
jgi:signal transduction histidine kinase